MSDKGEAASKLKKLRQRSGLTTRALAERLDMVHSSYQYYEDRYKKPYLPREFTEKLVHVLSDFGVAESEVLSLSGTNVHQLPTKDSPKVAIQGDNTGLPLMGLINHQTKDLPVLGAARGGTMGAGTFADNGNVFEMVERPAALSGVKEAYAVYVVDESMEPRYFSGELVHVHPHRPIRPGAFVVIQTDDGEERDYLLKRLVRRTGKKLILEQYNPAKRIEIDTALVRAIHLIVGAATPL